MITFRINYQAQQVHVFSPDLDAFIFFRKFNLSDYRENESFNTQLLENWIKKEINDVFNDESKEV